MTTTRRSCPKHDRYYHVCAACRTAVPAPRRVVAPLGLPARTPVGTPPAPPFPDYPDDDPRAYPPSRPSRLRIRGAVAL